MCEDTRALAGFCTVYSVVGGMFMVCVFGGDMHSLWHVTNGDAHLVPFLSLPFTSLFHCNPLFQLMVVLMLTHQPLIVGGIEDLGQAKANAYGALFSFVVTFGISVFYLVQDRVIGRSSTEGSNDRRRRGNMSHDYEGVPTNTNVLQDYALNLDLPRSVQEAVFS